MVKEKLNDQTDKPIATKVIIKFLFFLIFTLNNFIFSSINYLQIKGCTMETICAPSCANIFMGKFEKTDIYPYIRENKITCFWYIDDLFFIWKGTEGELLSFLENLNEKHPSINFDFKYSKIEIEFLDTKIYKDTNGKLCLTIYHKPTDWQNYLNFKSSHPPSNRQKSIPYSEAFRISNICTENWWIEAFLKHRYQKTSIDDQFNQLNHQKQ